jgi:hypothetical protein
MRSSGDTGDRSGCCDVRLLPGALAVLGGGARREDLDDPVRGTAAAGVVELGRVADDGHIRPAVAVIPSARPRASQAPCVIVACTISPDGSPMLTSACTGPLSKAVMVPWRLLRADRRTPESSVITNTDDALNKAITSAPTLRSKDLTLALVTTATSSPPPGRSTTTSALTAPAVTDATCPWN